MADTTNGTRSQRSKITLRDFGEPSIVKTMTPDQLKASGGMYVMGYLLGVATDFVTRTEPKTNEEFEGLKGTFALIPADKSIEELESGVLFIPDAFHNMVAERLRAMQKDRPGERCEVRFAFEVSSIPAKNPAGYSWNFKPAFKFAGGNPLDDLLEDVRAALPAAKQKLLPPPIRK